MDIHIGPRFVVAGRNSYPCVVGRAGIHTQKREGDGRTPVGNFALREVLYRPDRVARPATRLPVHPIRLRDGWCDAPEHSEYNRAVHLPLSASAERLWRADPLYDVIAVLGYNDDPVTAGAGSAIFLHVARVNFAPTEGCVALRRGDLLRVLAACDPGSRVIIQ